MTLILPMMGLPSSQVLWATLARGSKVQSPDIIPIRLAHTSSSCMLLAPASHTRSASTHAIASTRAIALWLPTAALYSYHNYHYGAAERDFHFLPKQPATLAPIAAAYGESTTTIPCARLAALVASQRYKLTLHNTTLSHSLCSHGSYAASTQSPDTARPHAPILKVTGHTTADAPAAPATGLAPQAVCTPATPNWSNVRSCGY